MIKKSFEGLRHDVIDKQLCCGCGTCAGICPVQCITFNNDLSIVPEKHENIECISCGCCLDVCPGNISPAQLIVPFSDEDKSKLFVGHACSDLIRQEAGSGGLITALADYSLRFKLVDQVAVVVPESDSSFRRIGVIVKDSEELKQSMQSCYCFIPLNLILRKIRKARLKTLFIGLPCHLQGVEKACKRDSLLSRLIIFKLSLFCGYNLTFDATIEAARRCGINLLENSFDVKRISYRSGAYSGNFEVFCDDSKRYILPLSEFRSLIPSYVPDRCLLCADGLGSLSDISFGDIYGQGDNQTCAIVRNVNGLQLIEGAKLSGIINIYPLKEMAARSGILEYMIEHHFFWSIALNFFRKNIRGSFVVYQEDTKIRLSKKHYCDAICHYLMIRVLQSFMMKYVFRFIPFLRFKLGHIVHAFPSWKWYKNLWKFAGKLLSK